MGRHLTQPFEACVARTSGSERKAHIKFDDFNR
jgi:hypothetical protein